MKTNNERGDTEALVAFVLVIIGLAMLAGLVTFGLWGCPQYNVYSSRLDGQALLAHATAAKEVAVAEAKAKKESASYLADAEVERAKGMAKANEIIGQSLKDNEDYLRYLWITEVAGTNVEKTVVYVPTESNLPVLEAGRLGAAPKK